MKLFKHKHILTWVEISAWGDLHYNLQSDIYIYPKATSSFLSDRYIVTEFKLGRNNSGKLLSYRRMPARKILPTYTDSLPQEVLESHWCCHRNSVKVVSTVTLTEHWRMYAHNRFITASSRRKQQIFNKFECFRHKGMGNTVLDS